jgi:hypothetical protein
MDPWVPSTTDIFLTGWVTIDLSRTTLLHEIYIETPPMTKLPDSCRQIVPPKRPHHLPRIRSLASRLILNQYVNFWKYLSTLTTDWTTGRKRFDPRQRQEDYFSNLCIQTGSAVQPDSCIRGTVDPFPGGRARLVRDADHSPHLVPRSWMSRSYISSHPARP